MNARLFAELGDGELQIACTSLVAADNFLLIHLHTVVA